MSILQSQQPIVVLSKHCNHIVIADGSQTVTDTELGGVVAAAWHCHSRHDNPVSRANPQPDKCYVHMGMHDSVCSRPPSRSP